MFNINKQINKLYASAVVGQLSLSGAWVAILASRGFSLAQIGFAETIFHIVSVLFEIPSGVLADIFGRKKMLVVSCLAHIIADIVMVFSNNFTLVCVSIALNAINYNFSSGSGDALAYDSMKFVGKECLFEKYASNQLVIYRLCEGISTLLAGLSLALGYRISYATSVVFSLFQLAILAGLKEIRLGEEKVASGLLSEMFRLFRESIVFLLKEKKAVGLMFANSTVGALDILLLFFLQAKLPEAGIPRWLLGVALLFLQMGGVAGSKLVLRIPHAKNRTVFIVSVLVIAAGIGLEHSGLYALMTLGGFVAALADDALQVRTNTMLQDMFPSEQRATLISMESFTFSMVMIVLSPLAGIFFTWW